MKVLFVFKSENFVAPLGLCTIAAVVRAAGHEAQLCEVNSMDLRETVLRVTPEVVAYSALTGEAKHYLAINRTIKELHPSTFSIMGGPHPTFHPEVVHEGRLDAICRGEGEGAMTDLLAALASGAPVAGIPNLVTPDTQPGPLRPLVQELDRVPSPDFALVYDGTAMGRYPLKSFMTSRGCPFDCTYCFNHAWRALYPGEGTRIRRFSVDRVLADIDQVRRRWPLSCVKFYDDIFALRVDAWLEEFATRYPREIGLPFFVLTRADLLDEAMVKLLKAAGCRTVSMSIEAANPQLREKVLRRRMDEQALVRAHLLCERYGLYTFTNCIIGLPDSTLEDDLASLDLSLRCKVDWAEFLTYHPYPGTVLGDETLRRGLYDQDYARMHTSYQHSSPLNCFTSQHKNRLRNLAVLGPVVVVLPILRPVLPYFLGLRHRAWSTVLYYFAKMFVLRRKIYVTKTSWLQSLLIFWRSLRQEFFRHERRDDVAERNKPKQ